MPAHSPNTHDLFHTELLKLRNQCHVPSCLAEVIDLQARAMRVHPGVLLHLGAGGQDRERPTPVRAVRPRRQAQAVRAACSDGGVHRQGSSE